MSSRTGINVDIIQTKLLFFRNYTDNAAPSTKNVLFADGSGGTYWSSLYIENIPGFSSFYNSTIGLCSTIYELATVGQSTAYGSTIVAYGNSLSTFSTNFNCSYMPLGVYSTVAGLGTLGFVSTPTLNLSLTSTVAGLNANILPSLQSSFSTIQFGRITSQRSVNVTDSNFEFISSTRRLAGLYFNSNTQVMGFGIGITPPSGALDVSGTTIFRNKLYVYSNVAIGKVASCNINSELDVSGNILASNIFVANQGIFNGSVTAASYLTSSDSNLKMHISTYVPDENVWDYVRGVRFNWKATDKVDIGFIAQELQQAIPEAVEVGKDGKLVIEPTKIIPLLVEEVKALKAKYSAMEARLAALEAK